MGRTTVARRRGATKGELRSTRRDVLAGMVFSSLVMYFVMLATGSTLFSAGEHDVRTAAQAAAALRPLAGEAASWIFAAGIVAVGVVALPIMTAGAAYDIVQAIGGRTSLQARPREAKGFYLTIAALTAAAAALNFLGVNPMRALVWAGVVQGFSTPALLAIIMLLTGSRKVMGRRANGGLTKVLGWTTTAAVSAASLALLVRWLRP